MASARYLRDSFDIRLLTLTSFLLSAAFSLLPLAGCTNERPPDYEVELEQIHKDISELKDSAFTAPIKIKKATKFVYLLYRRASLTGSSADFKVAETAINNAIQQIGPSEDFYLLRANLNFKLHRLANTKVDLEMITDLADSSQVKALKADIDLQEGRYEDARKGYEDVIQKNRTWDNLVRLAHLKSQTGDVSGAEKLYTEAQDEITAKEMRFYAWVELQRGHLDLRYGRYEEALAHYKHANRAYSGYWLIEEHIAELLGVQRRLTKRSRSTRR